MTIDKNTREYWDGRFGTGDWRDVNGCDQTRQFALAQVARIPLPKSFQGTILDFGCAEGDAMPVYRAKWPNATLIGMDFSEAAIFRARAKYSASAQFILGSIESCPTVDVIIASNVMEHLDDDIEVVRNLVRHCAHLFITVPFEEQYLIDEHVRAYDRSSFSDFDVLRIKVFACRGWTHYRFLRRLWHVHAKNILRPLFGRVRLNPRLQAMYHLRGAHQDD